MATGVEIEECPTCGSVKNESKRLAYLAACPDGHQVHRWFDINYLSEGIAHVWDDHTYSAARMQDFPRRSPEQRQALWLDWLDQCHAGRVARRPLITGEMVTFDPLLAGVANGQP